MATIWCAALAGGISWLALATDLLAVPNESCSSHDELDRMNLNLVGVCGDRWGRLDVCGRAKHDAPFLSKPMSECRTHWRFRLLPPRRVSAADLAFRRRALCKYRALRSERMPKKGPQRKRQGTNLLRETKLNF